MGLITNQSGIDQFGRRNVDLLRDRGVSIGVLLAPEHGVEGAQSSEVTIYDGIDAESGLPVVSLYKNGTGGKVPSAVMDTIDALLFDIQDSGMRHYTYISTMFHAMEVAAQHDKAIVILDRPNPLGVRMEGPLVAQGLKSFISIAPIPVRHGMTMGEIARYFNEWVLEKPVSLHVIPMEKYRRKDEQLVTQHAPLSPGLRTQQACYGYSFLGLLGEVRPFDIGMKSEFPFQAIMLPKELGVTDEQWKGLGKLLAKRGIQTRLHEHDSPSKKKRCHGLRVQIPNINEAQAFGAFLDVLTYVHDIGVKLSFSRDFNAAVGTREIRKLFEQQEVNIAPLRSSVERTIAGELRGFISRAKNLFLYSPHPMIG